MYRLKNFFYFIPILLNVFFLFTFVFEIYELKNLAILISKLDYGTWWILFVVEFFIIFFYYFYYLIFFRDFFWNKNLSSTKLWKILFFVFIIILNNIALLILWNSSTFVDFLAQNTFSDDYKSILKVIRSNRPFEILITIFNFLIIFVVIILINIRKHIQYVIYEYKFEERKNVKNKLFNTLSEFHDDKKYLSGDYLDIDEFN